MLTMVECAPPAPRRHVPSECDRARVGRDTDRQLRAPTAQHPVYRRFASNVDVKAYFDSTFAIGSSLPSRTAMASAQAASPG